MEFWYALFGILVLIMLFPYLRCFCKRLILKSKLKKACNNKGYLLHPAHPLWFFGSGRSEMCDLHVETKEEILSIKLFCMPRRHTVLVFGEQGEYYTRRFIVLSYFGGAIHFPINQKKKQMPNYDFRHGYKDEWQKKPAKQILLVNPVPMEFRRTQNEREIGVDPRDIINNLNVYSLNDLLSLLENS